MTPLIPLAEAQARLVGAITPLASETLPVAKAAGRYLAQPLEARRSQPAADLSAMDGYAVAGDAPWQVIGESRCGHPFGGALQTGEAIRISTGALMPEGADSVLLSEDSQREGDRLSHSGTAPEAGRHIRRAGFDFKAGEQLLTHGQRLGAAQLALALSAGHGDISLHRKPRLAIIDSGDELVRDPTACADHQLPASNAVMLAALAGREPCVCETMGPVADRLDALLAAFDGAAHADLIVTTGGASIGDHDLVRPALEAWGAKLDFWRVAIKPGKPLLVARRGDQTILGLPGNPASSFVTGFLFMLPAVRRLAGARVPFPEALSLPLAGTLPANGSRRTFLRAKLGPHGVTPLDNRDSSALLALSQANALIERPEHAEAIPAGTQVPVYML